MTILYVVLSPFLFIVGAAIMFFTARWQRKLRERGFRSGGALLGMYLIGGVWMLMGAVFMVYGVAGIR